MTLQRREFIAALGAAAVLPLAARAQQRTVPVVGFLDVGAGETNRVLAFLKGLSETGFIEGQNVAIEYRFTHGQFDRLPAMAADLVGRRVAVIVTPASIAAALAAKAATATIPIVFSTGIDPVQAGLVASLNRPGSNVTGVLTMNNEIGAKRLGLLHELLPSATQFAVLVNQTNPVVADAIAGDLKVAASDLKVQLEIFRAGTNRDIDAVLGSFVQKRLDALLVAPDGLFVVRRPQILTLAARHAIPVMFATREDVEAGGLMMYGSSITDVFRLSGIYTGRILKGEKPADLPVMRSTRFEFLINLQTAKTLGIDIPPTLLALADEVIE
jgi:putative ABC transport system substrate-binding protein